MLLTNDQHPFFILAESIPGFLYSKFYHWVNNRSKYGDRFENSMINDKDGHILLPLIIFTCTLLRQDLLKRQNNKGVHPKASKSKLKVDRPDGS
jgi:hypothetical protein